MYMLEGPYALLKHLILSFQTFHDDLRFIIPDGTISKLAFLNIHYYSFRFNLGLIQTSKKIQATPKNVLPTHNILKASKCMT